MSSKAEHRVNLPLRGRRRRRRQKGCISIARRAVGLFSRAQPGCMVFLPPIGGIYTGARRAPTFIYHLPFTIYHFLIFPPTGIPIVGQGSVISGACHRTPLRHYVALFAPLGNMSLDSQVATLPYESSSFATSRGRKGLGQGGSCGKRTAESGQRIADNSSLSH